MTLLQPIQTHSGLFRSRFARNPNFGWSEVAFSANEAQRIGSSALSYFGASGIRRISVACAHTLTGTSPVEVKITALRTT